MTLVKQADTITGGVLFLFSLAVLFESRKLPLIYLTAVGPGLLPAGVSLVLAALGALLFISGLRRNHAEEHTIVWPGGRGLARMVGVLVGLVGYTLLMPFLGYVLSTVAFMFVLISLLGSYRWYWSAGLSLVMALCTYFVFRLWLNLALPTGRLLIP